MNVLWISFPGTWTLPMLDAIKEHNRTGIIIPAPGARESRMEERDGLWIYTLALGAQECYGTMGTATARKYIAAIEMFRPDVIHVQGTEKNPAQVQYFVPGIPVVVSVQGLLSGCAPYVYNHLDTHAVRKFRTVKNLLGRGGIGMLGKSIRKGISQEQEFLQRGKYFIGRTAWDRAHILFHNPAATYFQGEELLRPEFYASRASWKPERCVRHSIFMPSGLNPLKGTHLAIEAVRLLKPIFPDVRLTVPGIPETAMKSNPLADFIFGEEYIRYLRHLIRAYGLGQNIAFLPKLDAAQMAEQMQRANVFLSPSSIDNSPNAVGEATMIGTPVVATPVGGVPSFLQDGFSALFAPAGDPYMMAYQIGRIFGEDELARSLSTGGYAVALRRHDVHKTAKQYTAIYTQLASRKL